jgi:hypothetical protein
VKSLTYSLLFTDTGVEPILDRFGGLVLPPLLEVRRVREGQASRHTNSLQGVTVRGPTEEEKKSLIVDRDANSCIAIYTIAQHMRAFDVHPFKPPLGLQEGNVPHA